jgi:hypothetical protein
MISIKVDKQKLDQLLKEKNEYVAIESVATGVNTAISIIITKIKKSYWYLLYPFKGVWQGNFNFIL